MDAQTLIAGVVVAGCSAWALWMLLPAGPRQWCRARLGLRPPATSPAGCSGCTACGGNTVAPGSPQVVKIVRPPCA